jgi:hypothetical protein
MLKKINQLGKKVTRKQMKGMKGGALIGAGKCIMPGQPCGGGGCTEPQPVCCYDYVCTGSNGIIYNPGFCVAPGGGGEEK